MLKKGIFIGLYATVITSCLAQNSLNYFYNLSYKNPAFESKHRFQGDFNSFSYYNNLPLGIYGIGINVQVSDGKQLGGSLQYNQLQIGKNQTSSQTQLFANYYTKLNFTHQLTLGIGIKRMAQAIDESKLSTNLELNGLVYGYGSAVYTSSSLLIPMGIDLSNEKINIGAYFAPGISTDAQYGIYGRFLTFESSINTYQLENFSSLAFSKELLNPKISFSDQISIDNYKFEVFGQYNLGKELKQYLDFGLGIHYHWKVFDINIQSALNNQKLGLSHQLGLQLYY